MLKDGVLWDDVHLEAHKIAIKGLLSLGILQGAEEDILKSRTSVAFFPHGLGHYLGMGSSCFLATLLLSFYGSSRGRSCFRS